MSSTGRDNDPPTGSVEDDPSPGTHALISDDLEPILFCGILEEGGGNHSSAASHAQSSHNSATVDLNRQGVLSNQCTLRSPPRDGKSIRSDIAFGDGDGTSGFVNESGELICIVQMLDMGPTGLFRARPNYRIPSPTDDSSSPLRTDHPFGDIIQGKKLGLGLNLIRDELFEHGSHQIDFVHDRWPRFSSHYQKLDVETQVCIKDNRVIQHYILRSKDSINVKFVFNAAVSIDDPYMSSELKGACNINGGIFSTGGTAVALAGGAGGHVRFFASLFKDAQPTTLDLSDREINQPAYYDLPSPDYFRSDRQVDENLYKWAFWLSQYEEVAMLEGETRTMTGIYHFEFENWSRDDIYALHLIPEGLHGHDETAHRVREEQFMREFEDVKTFRPEASEQFAPDQSKIFNDHVEAVPFSNWGGQATASQRLFGLEWKKVYWKDLLPNGLQIEFAEKFSNIRRDISQKHSKIFLSKPYSVPYLKLAPSSLGKPAKHLECLKSLLSFGFCSICISLLISQDVGS